MDYAARHLLPQRRLELYLAQAAWVSAAAMGGYKGDLRDFVLFDPPENGAPSAEAQSAAEDALFAGFSPE